MTQNYIIYFNYKEQFEIDNRLFTNHLIAQKEAIRLGKLFDNSGEGNAILKFSNNCRHTVFSSPTIQVYVLQLSLYPKM